MPARDPAIHQERTTQRCDESSTHATMTPRNHGRQKIYQKNQKKSTASVSLDDRVPSCGSAEQDRAVMPSSSSSFSSSTPKNKERLRGRLWGFCGSPPQPPSPSVMPTSRPGTFHDFHISNELQRRLPHARIHACPCRRGRSGQPSHQRAHRTTVPTRGQHFTHWSACICDNERFVKAANVFRSTLQHAHLSCWKGTRTGTSNSSEDLARRTNAIAWFQPPQKLSKNGDPKSEMQQLY